ncbi:hypothetical protein [Methylobacterium sp. GXS13]|uniref:hypothetical protein n=1 Tax=Methylobacterium sp. GXS13 TaxID=1730094 RepID=UPI000B003DFE|nr:hypothetical protein [Methylobacterium sp. GXS13]
MREPPVIGLEKLKLHLTQVELILRSAADPSAQLKLQLDQNGDPVVAGIVGGGCERANRTRGLTTPIAPWIDLRGGLWAWFGYREEWSIRTSGNHPTFAFRASSLTVHFGFKATDPKPQMFRAEWAGPVEIASQWTMQGGDAGHPHWQFDAMDSLLAPAKIEEANVFAEILRAEFEEGAPKDFVATNAAASEVSDVVAARSLASLHFASAAHWWHRSQGGNHAHVPTDENQIRVWLSKTLSYLAQELQRI